MQSQTPAPHDYSALFVFGDSLSDNGAIASFTGGTIPPAQLSGTNRAGEPVDFAARDIFYAGKFTNGDTYAEVAADLLGIASDTSTFYDDFSGSNLAVGAASATDLSQFGGVAINSFADQLASFQSAIAALPGTQAEKATFLADAAASVFLGLNDLASLGQVATASGEIDLDDFATGVAAIVSELTLQTETLATTGVGTIILNTLPGVSFFPDANALIDQFGPGTAALFDRITAEVNDGIRQLAGTLAETGTKVEVVDFFALARDIQADPETFGFLTLENALASSLAVNTLLIEDVPIDQIGFIDPVHFTAEMHQIFGAYQARTLGDARLTAAETGGITVGTEAEDTVFASAALDRVRAGDGADLIFAGAGNDRTFAGAGQDVVFGGTGRDVLFGEEGADILSGGAGADLLFGGAGGDVLAGNGGDDLLTGGEGNDVLISGLGRDVLSGGAGDDTLIFRAQGTLGGVDGQSEAFFFGGAGADRLLILSDTQIGDVDSYLDAQNVRVSGIEEISVVARDAIDGDDPGLAGVPVDLAGLFGLI